jgi:hypothetical protein
MYMTLAEEASRGNKKGRSRLVRGLPDLLCGEARVNESVRGKDSNRIHSARRAREHTRAAGHDHGARTVSHCCHLLVHLLAKTGVGLEGMRKGYWTSEVIFAIHTQHIAERHGVSEWMKGSFKVGAEQAQASPGNGILNSGRNGQIYSKRVPHHTRSFQHGAVGLAKHLLRQRK